MVCLKPITELEKIVLDPSHLGWVIKIGTKLPLDLRLEIIEMFMRFKFTFGLSPRHAKDKLVDHFSSTNRSISHLILINSNF